MSVLSFYLTPFKDDKAVFLLKARIISWFELAVFRQHNAINRKVARSYPLAVVFYLGPSIVVLDLVVMHVKNHRNTC